MKLRNFSLKTDLENRKDNYAADELFHANEVQANRLIMSVLIGCAVILLLIIGAVLVGVFPLAGSKVVPACVSALIMISVLGGVSAVVKGDAWWLKYLLLVGLTLVFARVDMLLTHKTSLLMCIPVLCSARYFSRQLTKKMSLLVVIAFFISALLGAYLGWINVNDVTLPIGTTVTNSTIWVGSAVEEVINRGEYARNTIIFSYIPKLLIYSIVAVVCVKIAERGRMMVEEQKETSERKAGIMAELHTANRIQESMLPGVFPPFPDRHEFDIYATMQPAREVGGDFYDFFLIDEDHLCLVMADVSGKGVPAALFMMISKVILQSCAMLGKDAAEILNKTNEALCSNNQVEMFVTVWLGILEISTGIMTCSNAGHEYPALKQGEKFELYKDRHGFVIGGMASSHYRPYELRLQPGDKVFVYTDGVPEATDIKEELFGTARMIKALNTAADRTPEEILHAVDSAVKIFVADAEQFDDMTMMCLAYNGTGKSVHEQEVLT